MFIIRNKQQKLTNGKNINNQTNFWTKQSVRELHAFIPSSRKAPELGGEEKGEKMTPKMDVSGAWEACSDCRVLWTNHSRTSASPPPPPPPHEQMWRAGREKYDFSASCWQARFDRCGSNGSGARTFVPTWRRWRVDSNWITIPSWNKREWGEGASGIVVMVVLRGLREMGGGGGGGSKTNGSN